MADIASAIKMEEEAFKRMKKQSLRKANSSDARKYAGLLFFCCCYQAGK